jgi:hypothetical protein
MRASPVYGRVLRVRARPAALALALALAPWAAGATSADDDDGPASAAEPDLGELWREAQARMETSDYGGAIEVLTRLYQRIARDPEAKILRLRVRWTLQEAHLHAYGLGHDPTHLLVAEDLLVGYLEDLGEGEGRLREEGNAALEDVRAKLAEHREQEAQRQEAQRQEAQRRATEEAERRAAAEAQRDESSTQVEPPSEPTFASDRPARPLWIAGGLLSGLGVVGVGMTIGGFASAGRAVGVFEREPDRRERARDDVRRGNAIGITGAIVGGTLLTTGAALLAIALRRKRVSSPVTAWLGPEGIGLGWTGRF